LLVLKLSKDILPANGPSAVSKSVVTGHTASPISLLSDNATPPYLLPVIQVSLEDYKTTLGQVCNELWGDSRHILVRVLGSPEIVKAELAIKGYGEAEFA
jgi:hypothetical protein